MRSSIILFFAVPCFIFYSCSRKKEEKAPAGTDLSRNIVGSWNAYWEMTGEEVKDYAPRQRKMKGKMTFRDNGKATVTTYGFDGCIFMPDTSTNTMNWKIENEVLRFMDKNDIHGIPYNIESYTDDEIHLTIMENIHLTLTR